MRWNQLKILCILNYDKYIRKRLTVRCDLYLCNHILKLVIKVSVS